MIANFQGDGAKDEAPEQELLHRASPRRGKRFEPGRRLV